MSMRLVIHGVGGRMGQSVQALVQAAPDMELIGGIRRQPTESNEFSSLTELATPPDVIIDFSLPDALDGLIDYCQCHRVALVSGTTGLDNSQIFELRRLAESVAVLYAANMSRGVALMRRLVQQAAAAAGPRCDIDILEHHHNRKLDAPSGTALMLGEVAARAAGQENDPNPDRRGQRTRGRIGHAVLRGGDVVGEHTAYFHLDGERIEIAHRAANRSVFAHGAVAAARWLHGQPSGFYSIDDTLGE